jgi:CheY-like chemotaxis protein
VVLENAGATVCTAASAAEGLAEFARFEPDVVLSDIAMPGEDGYTFIQKLRSLPLGKDVPALALTAFVRQADRTRAFQAGFNGHLRKPVAPDALVGAVADAVRRSVKSSAD